MVGSIIWVGEVFAKDLEIANSKSAWPIVIEPSAVKPIQTAANHFLEDINRITGNKPTLLGNLPKREKQVILAGTLDGSPLVRQLVASGKIKVPNDALQWEGFTIQMVERPFKGIDRALVITGNHFRGVVYGLFHLSRSFGVSPWYWWADVPVEKKASIRLPEDYSYHDFPKVKYRGIFINDEAPALSNWSREKFGGFNARFYEKVFELMLRLQSNYIWPAMWGNAFYDDDSLNILKADEYGVVIGTSHHEPLMRAHDEWRRYGTGKWNYDSNAAVLRDFWKGGLQRSWNEKIVTIGMRGDGDEPMSRETATALLERIVSDQRKIISEVTKKPAEETPQLWALYKEVQDYYDKGMRVPDDVTLLLCDDNWGNIRRLPDPNEKPRKGGYGIYYHFDYVGGPRNYKWLNTNHISRIWEQMHLAWQYKARQIWIVNVGDIKPMEFPISFFLDYAWDPEKIGADDLMGYTEQWAADQFGNGVAKEVAYLYDNYSKINSRRKPELLDANTFKFNYNEWDRVVAEYDALLNKAEDLQKNIPAAHQDAYFQLILHPVKAMANLYRMYYAVAQNKRLVPMGDSLANYYARRVRSYYNTDSLISVEYHKINQGKWNHMMSQTHIGYTYWQQPPVNRMPQTELVSHYNLRPKLLNKQRPDITAESLIPAGITHPVFYELNGAASIHADNFSRKQDVASAKWKILKGQGRTGNAITTIPVTHPRFNNVNESPWLEYDVYTYSADTMVLHFQFSPTLNFLHDSNGLQFAVSVNGASPEVVSMNKLDYDSRTWEGWVASNSISVKTGHALPKAGKQTIRFYPLHPGIILQNIICDLGGLQPSYLGPIETKFKTTK